MEFAVRVQLVEDRHPADWLAFYRAMGDAGFYDVVVLEGGARCRLPNGEWQIQGLDSNAAVAALLNRTAPASGVPFRAMIMQITFPVTHVNADIVEPEPAARAFSQLVRRPILPQG